MHAVSLPQPVPVRSSADARQLLALAVQRPYEPETLAFLLDPDGVGGLIIAVNDTEHPDAVQHVAAIMARVGEGVEWAHGLVIATVRPHDGVLPGDVDRWLDASSIARDHGIELIEWYVIGPHGTQCPRDLLGEPERWGR